MKRANNRAWLLVLPVLIVVAFSAVIPLMTVVNYSVQDSFGNNEFFWVGTEWFEEVLHSERFHNALLRNLAFSAIILLIEIPLGIGIALCMPRRGTKRFVTRDLWAGRKVIRQQIADSQYLVFAFSGYVGDWGTVACRMARRMGRPHAVFLRRQ